MRLKTSGTVLGVRRNVNTTTGEQSDYADLDLYTDGGPVTLSVPASLDVPEPGVFVEVDVAVRAFSGFPRQDKRTGALSVGDARVQFSATRVVWADPPAGSTPAQLRRKVPANA